MSEEQTKPRAKPKSAGQAKAPLTLVAKMLEIQRVLEPMTKDSTNPHFKSSYFDINSLLGVIRPIINKFNILLYQPIVEIEGISVLRTSFVDVESGESLISDIRLPVSDNPQKIGGAITYYRRYALQSMLGLEAQDDDGNTAVSGKPVSSIKKAPVSKAAVNNNSF